MMRSDYRNKIMFLCMVLVIGRFAFDMYFPSLLFIAEQFKVDYSVIERTVSAYLLGMTFCQLLFGPLSDCWGRKKVLLLGFALFILGSIVCVLSNDANMLIFGRLLCGVGLSVGPCLKRALLVDWFDDKRVIAKVGGSVSSALMFATIIAPYLGGLLQDYTNSWRLSFVLIGIWGVFIFLYVMHFFKEAKSFGGVFAVKVIMQDYVNICYNRQFMLFSIVSGLVFANMLVYFQIIPYIFAIDAKTPPAHFGYAAALAGISYMIGGYLLHIFRDRSNQWILVASLYLIICAAVFSAVVFALCEQKLFVAIPLLMFFIAVRWLVPAALAEAMVTQGKSGTASSVMGFIQYIFCTILSYGFSFLSGEKVAYIFFIEMFVISVISYIALQRYSYKEGVTGSYQEV